MATERRSAQEQYRLIMECRSSGMTDYQWCEANGIKPGTFHSWVMRLKKKYDFDIPKRNRMRLSPSPKQDVVRLDVVDEDMLVHNEPSLTDSTRSFSSSEPAIEIHVSGLDIKVANHANPELVLHILRSIGGGVC